MYQTLYLPLVEDTFNLWGLEVYPVQNGIFIWYDKSSIRFYERS